MIPAYRLVCDNPHARPQLWEYEQPYIHTLCLNARTFGRRVAHRYFRDRNTLARKNARIWEMHYRCRLLYAPLHTWEVWLAEYRTLMIEVQDMAEEHHRAARRGSGCHSL